MLMKNFCCILLLSIVPAGLAFGAPSLTTITGQGMTSPRLDFSSIGAPVTGQTGSDRVTSSIPRTDASKIALEPLDREIQTSFDTANLDVARSCRSPRTMPRFAVPIDMVNAMVVSEHDLRNRPSMLIFFAPHQQASARAVAISQRMATRFRSHALAVVGFEVDIQPNANSNIEPKEHDPAITRHNLNMGFPVGRDCCGAQRLFCVSDVPTIFFVDRRGKMSKMLPAELTASRIERSVRSLLKR